MRDEITNHLQTSVRQWISNFIPNFVMEVMIYPSWWYRYTLLVKWTPALGCHMSSKFLFNIRTGIRLQTHLRAKALPEQRCWYILNCTISNWILQNLNKISHSQIYMKMSSAKESPFLPALKVVIPYLNDRSLRVNGWMYEWNFHRKQTIMDMKLDGNKYETDNHFERKY